MPLFRPVFLNLYIIVLCFFAPACISHAQSYPQVSVFIDADKSFVDSVGGSVRATTFINELIAKVDALYRSQLGLTVKLAGTHLWSVEDAFNRTDQTTLLASFADYAETRYRSLYTYDVAHLLVGSGLGGEGGVAFSRSACGDALNAPNAYGLSEPDLRDTYEFNVHLFSHELGHTLGAEHDAFPACAVKTVMCVAQIGGTFSEQSKSQINAYVTSRSAAGCFPQVSKLDPSSSVKVKVSVTGTTVNYTVTGSSACTALTLVGAPSLVGLKTIFGYLQIGKLKPAASVSATSRNVTALIGSSKLYVGAYCDGQLVPGAKLLNLKKVHSRSVTSSAVVALRKLQKNFRAK